MRPVPLAVASGSLSSLVFAFAKELFLGNLREPDFNPPATSSELCSLLQPTPSWQLDHCSLIIGILVGFLLGPVLDLVVLLRISWVRFVRGQGRLSGGRALFRILE